MSLVALQKNSIRSWAQLYCWVKKKVKTAIFYSFSVLFGLNEPLWWWNHIREINYWLSLSVMTDKVMQKHSIKCARKRLSVTWDDFCVVRHIFKTFLCLKIQNCLTHRIYIDRLSCVDKTSYFKVMHTTLDFLLNEPVFSKFIRDMTWVLSWC